MLWHRRLRSPSIVRLSYDTVSLPPLRQLIDEGNHKVSRITQPSRHHKNRLHHIVNRQVKKWAMAMAAGRKREKSVPTVMRSVECRHSIARMNVDRRAGGVTYGQKTAVNVTGEEHDSSSPALYSLGCRRCLRLQAIEALVVHACPSSKIIFTSLHVTLFVVPVICQSSAIVNRDTIFGQILTYPRSPANAIHSVSTDMESEILTPVLSIFAIWNYVTHSKSGLPLTYGR